MDIRPLYTTAFVAVAFIMLLFIGISIYMISKNRRSERQLMSANKRYLDLINNIQGGVITCIFDHKSSSSRTIYINDGWTELTGYTMDELNSTLGGNPQALVHPEDREIANRDYAQQTASGNVYRLEYRIIRKDGTIVWAIDRGVVTVDDFGNVQNQSIISEVTEIKEKEEQLLRLAQTDPLTGLYNKTTSAMMITGKLEENSSSLHALMIVDIDNFKGVNDSLGHIFGDTVLIEVSARLRRLMGSGDIVGRIGGDEFMVLMTDIASREAAENKAETICETFRNTYTGENDSYKISCSMGIAFSTDGKNLQELFAKADCAMYRAKAMGKDRYLIYKSDRDDIRLPTLELSTSDSPVSVLYQ